MEGTVINIELLQKLGDMRQIAGIREIECTRGPEKGQALIEVYNAAGLRFTLTPDRCLDMYDFSYKGTNIAFYSKNRLNAGRNPAVDEFFHQWPAGMLSTCGLSNVGAACDDSGMHPIHGRIAATPASNVQVDEGWHDDDYIITVSALTRETRLYGRHLSLNRHVSVGLYDKAVTITDVITNHCHTDEEFMLLYHINFGYPLLDTNSKAVLPGSISVEARNSGSKDHVNMCAPGAEPADQFFLHTFEGSTATAAIINPSLALAGYVEYNTENLPYLGEWKNMAPHDYVAALEPCNCTVLGRVNERKNKTLAVLPAYSSITNQLKLGIISGNEEINAYYKGRDN